MCHCGNQSLSILITTTKLNLNKQKFTENCESILQYFWNGIRNIYEYKSVTCEQLLTSFRAHSKYKEYKSFISTRYDSIDSVSIQLTLHIVQLNWLDWMREGESFTELFIYFKHAQ